MAADLILPAAMWVEKEGAYGNAERRTHVWHQLVDAPGEARSDLWQLMEFSKRFTTDEVWPADLLAPIPTIAARPCSTCSSATAGRQVSLERDRRGLRECRIQGFRLLCPEGPVRGIRQRSAAAMATISAPSTLYHEVRGLRWPVVDGKETLWRYREGYDPYVKPGKGVEFYGNKDGKARIIAVPYEPPAESPDGEYVLAGHRAACWNTGTPAR
jgi:nitrate reductase NapA